MSESSASERLRRIQWERVEVCKRSYLTLLAEYLRRAAMWSTELALSTENPFFDLTDAIGAHNQDASIGGADLLMTGGNGNILEQLVCQWYMKWEGVSEEIRDTYSDLPDLYEPLIRLFERGGVLRTHHGFVEMGRRSMPFLDWKTREQAPALDIRDARLDSLD